MASLSDFFDWLDFAPARNRGIISAGSDCQKTKTTKTNNSPMKTTTTLLICVLALSGRGLAQVTGNNLNIGSGHSISPVYSSIAGGEENAISGGDDAFIGAGTLNLISTGAYSFIGGGSENWISIE